MKDYYVELVDGKLEKDITFMTCVYFVGVDIHERYQLVSVVNADIPYTLLSIDRLTQIRGRCRHEDGLISETIQLKRIININLEIFQRRNTGIDY